MRKRLICALLALVMLIGVVPSVPLVAKAESNMTASQSLVDLLKAFEGFHGACFVDTSQRSVGYGTRCDVCDPNMPGYLDGNRKCTAYNDETPITPEKAEALMRNFLISFESSLNRMIDTHNLTLTQQQFDALLSLTYNLGGGWTYNYGGRYTTLYNAVTSGDTGAALAYAVGLYKTSGGVPSVGHIHRRMLELQVYFYGIYGIDQVYNYKKWPEKVRFIYLDGNGGKVVNDIHAFDIGHPTEIFYEFSQKPTGVDESGNPFTYEFAGWFTQREGGKQVTKLTEAITNGMVLYAHWKNPAGEVVTLPVDTGAVTDEDVTVVVNNWDTALHEGPGDYFSEVRRMTQYEQLYINKVTTGKDGKLWGQSADGWVLLSKTNYDSVKPQTPPDTAEGTWYKVTVDIVNVRAEHSTENNDNIKYTKEFDDRIKIVETYNEMQGESILRIWGKLTDGNWICMKNGEKDYVAVDSNQDSSSGGAQTTPVTGEIITSISLETAPNRKKYELNDGWVYPDLTGGTIKIHYSPNSYKDKVVNITRSMISGFDDSVEGVQTVTVTCSGHSVTFEVQVVQTIVTSIAVQKMPTKTEYVQGGKETLDVTGGTLLVTYNDGTTAEVPMTGDMVTGFDNSQLGSATVGLKYEDCTTSFGVTVVSPVLTSISMQTLPAKTQYLHMLETLDVTGGVLQLNYTGGISETVSITPEMVTGFDNTVLGMQTLTVSYAEMTTTFSVEIKKLTVVFKNYDGSVISSAQYAYGEPVSAPADPTKPADNKGEYAFAGWDRPVVDCTGNTEYIAVYELKYPIGDIDRNQVVNEDDAIYLLRYVVFPDKHPISCVPDFDANGAVDEDDAIYLLRHVVFPDKYPLTIS